MIRRFFLVAASVWLGLLAGCEGESPPPSADASVARVWACPPGWVATRHGGCGPAALLCAPGGGAATGACDRVDLAHPPPIALPDGGTVPGFRRLPDGGIGGAWPEQDDPAEPNRAGIAACPEGWRRLDDGTCDPALRDDCPSGSAALPGGACTPTSESDCPAGEYAEPGVEATGARVVHVRAMADATAADGSAERPYPRIEDGIEHVGARGWVLVARGTYRERPLVEGATVHVVGVCAARVILEALTPSAGPSPTFNTRSVGSDLTLRNITIRGFGYGLQVHSGARLSASGVVIDGCGGVGVFANGAGTRLELSQSVIRATRALVGVTGATGVYVGTGVAARVSGVALDDNVRVAMRFGGEGTTGELTSCAVRGTLPDEEGAYGVGVIVQDGARVRATGLLLDDGRQTGLSVYGMGTEATLVGAIVRGTRASLAFDTGNGVEVSRGATLRATDLLVDDNVGVGVLTTDEGSVLEIASSVVRATAPSRLGNAGQGVSAIRGAAVRATRVVVDRSAVFGVLADGRGSSVEVRSSVVRGTRPDAAGRFGNGMFARDGAVLRATGVLVEANVSSGVLVGREGARVEISGSAIRDTRPEARGVYGRAIEAVEGSEVHVRGALLANNAEAAVWATGPNARVDARDLLVVGVRPTVGGFGVGLYAISDAQFTGARVALQSIAGAAIVALPYEGHRAVVSVEDLFAREVRPSTIQVDDQGGIGFPAGANVAYGLHAGPGCAIEAARAVIDTSDYGLFNASGTVRVRVGVIARQRQAIGAFDLGTAPGATTLEGVSSRDNLVDTLVRRDDLPVASSIAAPEDPCADGC